MLMAVAFTTSGPLDAPQVIAIGTPDWAHVSANKHRLKHPGAPTWVVQGAAKEVTG